MVVSLVPVLVLLVGLGAVAAVDVLPPLLLPRAEVDLLTLAPLRMSLPLAEPRNITHAGVDGDVVTRDQLGVRQAFETHTLSKIQQNNKSRRGLIRGISQCAEDAEDKAVFDLLVDILHHYLVGLENAVVIIWIARKRAALCF